MRFCFFCAINLSRVVYMDDRQLERTTVTFGCCKIHVNSPKNIFQITRIGIQPTRLPLLRKHFPMTTMSGKVCGLLLHQQDCVSVKTH